MPDTSRSGQDPPLYDEAAGLAELARHRLRRDQATRVQVQMADRLAEAMLRHFSAEEAETAGRALLVGAASAVDLASEGIHASVIVNVLGFAAARIVTDSRAAAADSRIVSFDLMPKEPDYYFVLSEALKEFAGRQRAIADGLEDGDYESRIRWAETAEDALEQIEQALTPATVGGIVAASIEQHGAAALVQLDAELTQYRSAPEGTRGDSG